MEGMKEKWRRWKMDGGGKRIKYVEGRRSGVQVESKRMEGGGDACGYQENKDGGRSGCRWIAGR